MTNICTYLYHNFYYVYVSNILLNVFELIVGLNGHERCMQYCLVMRIINVGYDNYHFAVADHETLKFKQLAIINFVCFAILSYCHLLLLLNIRTMVNLLREKSIMLLSFQLFFRLFF